MNVPKGYDRNREHRTVHEAKGWSKGELRRRERNQKWRRRNLEPGRFGKANWNAYEHYQLYDMIMKANPERMSEHAFRWDRLARGIEATTSEVRNTLERAMGAWRGQAAVSSAGSNSRLMGWAGEASTTASRIAAGMSTYTEAVAEAQSKMPDPAFASAERNFREGYTVTGTGGPSTAILVRQLLSDGMVSHEQARARKAEAVQVMETYEAQSKDVHDSLPRFTPANPTTTQTDAWKPTPDPHQPPPVRPLPHPPPGHGTDDPPGTQPYPPGVRGPDDTTTAAGFVDPTLPGTGSGGPGSGPGGYGGTGYGGGIGSLGSGGADTARGGPGLGAGGLAGVGGAGGVPGRGPAGAPGAAALGARGAAAPGMGAFGGMPLGGGAPGEEDKEHRNKYDEGMDFLDDLPPAYPSVFGA